MNFGARLNRKGWRWLKYTSQSLDLFAKADFIQKVPQNSSDKVLLVSCFLAGSNIEPCLHPAETAETSFDDNFSTILLV